MATLNINSDNIIELRGLKNATSGQAITTATVSITLTEKITGTAVSGVTWPLSLTHVASGTYRGNIPDDAVLNRALSYIGTIIADNGVNQHREWCEEYTVVCS